MTKTFWLTFLGHGVCNTSETFNICIPYLACCTIDFIGCACLSESGSSSVFWSSNLFMALHQNILVSSADQTLKTLLVLDSAHQHTAISRFHIRRSILMIVRLQSPGQHHIHRTDYQQVSGHLTDWHSAEFQEQIESSLLLMDHFFFFFIHL